VPRSSAGTTAVYLESVPRRSFASAADWPGWCRSGKTEAQALEALAAYAPRYALVADAAGIRFPAAAGRRLEVVERLPGSATTEFGAPGEAARGDAAPLTTSEAVRLAALVAASWAAFDRTVKGAPEELRKGPRGGGRDRDQIVDHVLAAESAYASKLGLRLRPPDAADRKALAAFRGAIEATLRDAAKTGPLREKGWLARYAARRIAWHVLDHTWEIEDRSDG
jgi:hypothetical protein